MRARSLVGQVMGEVDVQLNDRLDFAEPFLGLDPNMQDATQLLDCPSLPGTVDRLDEEHRQRAPWFT